MNLPEPLTFSLTAMLAAITTLATIVAIGVAFLARPSKATLYWAFAFALAMLATSASAAGEVLPFEPLRRAGLGALMGAPAFLWSGYRAHWGLRAFPWCGAIVAVVWACLLGLPAFDPWYLLLYRCAFLTAAAFAALFVIDWLRAGSRRRDPLTAPLAVASLIFVVLGISVALSWTSAAPGMRDLQLARVISSVLMIVYVVCAAAAVTAVSTRAAMAARRSSAVGDWDAFQELAGARLREGVRVGESLSFVYLQLDDLREIRRAAGAGTVSRLTRQFVDEVREVFPTKSLIDSPAPGAAVALISLGEASVRDRLRILLERISMIDAGGRLPIHPSASAGWAPTSVVGYELDALLYMAREASVVATQDGGDRWERVGIAVTERILSRSAQP